MSWPLKSLDELGFVGRGKSKHRPRDAAHLYNGPYPFIQTGDVKHAHFYITEHKQTYSEAGLAQSKLWEKDTLCVTIAANIADTAILSYDACFPDSVIGIIPDKDKADVRFIKYLLDTLRESYKKISQGAAQDNLSQQKLLSLKFPTPPLQVQTQIADVLSTYDYLIENNRRRIQLLEESGRLLYREWFVHLRFPGHAHVKINGGVPEGWEKRIVSSLGQVITGKTPSTKEEDNYGDDTPFIKTPDMHGTPIIIEAGQSLSEKGANTQPKKFIPEGSIMVSCIGTVGIVSLNGCKAQTNQQINTVIPNKDILRYYSYFALSDLKPMLEAIGGGATMPNVNKGKFESLPSVIPSDSILNEFEDFCCPTFKQIKKLLIQNKKLKEARNLLLPRLMNGEITA